MHNTMLVAALSFLASTSLAHSPNPIYPGIHQQALHSPETLPTKRVAIIGAGSAGASTAYYLRNYTTHASLATNITVYERQDYIGGRSTTVNAYSDPLQPVELGASIFVTVNRNLVTAAKELGLSTSSLSTRIASNGATIPALGVYDGTDFVLMMENDGGWWQNVKLLWRYGAAPIKTIRLMRATVGKFLKMYEEPYFPFTSLTGVAMELGLVDATAVSGQEYMVANGIGGDFGWDVVQASTRVNYAQDLAKIHGLEAMVCMAAEGAMSVEGGNWRIFDGMLRASGADVRMGTEVGLIEKEEDHSWTLSSRSEDGEMQVETFDEVVLAAPKQFSDLEFPAGLPAHQPDKIPYVNLHTTLFTSKHLLDPIAFGLKTGDAVPQALLTTLPKDKKASGPDFQSISILQPVRNPESGQNEYLYKIFSMQEPNSTFMGRILGLGHLDADAEIAEQDVSWVYRKLWQSYPYEYPRVTFEEIKLDDHFWYTSGIESFISTMETSSLMGMNVARLMVDEWLR